MKRILVSMTVAAASTLAISSPALAKAYPEAGKPISLIVPFAPGGASDILSRLVGQKLSELWNTPVVIQNKPGGDMVIALQTVARADKDGYTFGLTTSSFALTKAVKKDLPLDPVEDFSPIGLIGKSPYIMSVNADSDIKSFKELEAATNVKNSIFNYASCCFGTYFTAELIKLNSDTKGTHVPYKGSTPAMNAILAKEVEYIIDTTTASKPFITSDKLRPLLVSSRERSPSFPDVPSLTEAGVGGDFEMGVWYGFVFPANTPEAIVNKTNEALNTILAMPDVQQRIESFEIELTPSTPEEMKNRIVSDTKQFDSAVKEANLTFGN